jgi:Holliday junction resolvase-like predicted endonuclease
VPSKKKLVGNHAEDIAVKYLLCNQWKIIGRNQRLASGFNRLGRPIQTEVDILAMKEKELLLFEVKFRSRADVESANWQLLSDRQLSRLQRARCYAAAIYPTFRIRIVLLWVDESQTVHFLENY